MKTLFVALAALSASLVNGVCVQSTEHDYCVELDKAAPAVNTINEAKLLNKVYKGDVRVELMNGTYAMIEHTTAKHIGSVEGTALSYLQGAISRVEKRQGVPCTHNACVIVTSCGQGCAFCYPVVCL